VFFLLAYLLSACAQQIEQLSPPSFRVPHSVNLFLSGLALGRVGKWMPDTELGRTVSDFMEIDPHIIFWVLLPALLYEDASGVKWHVMKKVLPSALLLAVPGVIVNALLTGAIIKGTFTSNDWTWDSVFLLGSILSATDPVAVVGALHELAAPDRLSLLISGESLFNDGSAVVIFSLFWDSARGIRELSPGYSIGYFIQLACGGPLLGFAVAMVAFLWLKQTRKFSIEILVIIVSVYGSFFVSEHSKVKVSGVLAVVVFGFFMAARGHFALHIEQVHRHHAVIHFLALLSNEAIFVLGGVVSFRVLYAGYFSTGHGYSNFGARVWLELVLLYLIIHGTRTVVIALGMPLLRRWGYGLTLKEAAVCVFGGLRGAVGLAMALLVEHDTRLGETTRAQIAFFTSGIVVATLLINGTTMTAVYRKLRVYQKAQHHEKLLRMALMKADDLTQRRGVMLEQHWFFHNCCFGELLQAVPKLAQAAEQLEQERLGSASTRTREPPKGHLPVHDVMTNIATRLGARGEEGLHAHYMQKLRFRRRWARSGANVFIPTSLAHADEDEEAHHEVIELALRMSHVELRQTTGIRVQPPEALPDDVPSSPAEDAEAVAKSESDHQARRRSRELQLPSAAHRPYVAWSGSSDTVQVVDLTDSTPSSRSRSRVQFCVPDAPDEPQENCCGSVTASAQLRVPSRMATGSRVATRCKTGEDVFWASEMDEYDRRMLLIDLRKQSRCRTVESRKKSKSQTPSLNAQPVHHRSAEPSSASSHHDQRTCLQAQRVDALLQHRKIENMGCNVTLALLTAELKTAIVKNHPQTRASARWRIAKLRVIWAIRRIQDALQEHQKLVEGTTKLARMASRMSSLGSSSIVGDAASMVEVYHTVLNATRSSYKEMYEARAVPEGPFRVLMESLELQEEAIDGELRSAPKVPADHALYARLKKLPHAAHEDQMALSFAVAWQYIVAHGNRACSVGYLDGLHRRCCVHADWWQMKHNIVTVLAFIMTQEHIVEELEVVSNFEEQLKKPMLQITENAKADILYRLMLQSPAMFCLLEHVLCLQLMLDFQRRLFKELVNDGVLAEEDAEHLNKRVLQPVLAALDRYVPTRDQLCLRRRSWSKTPCASHPRLVHPELSAPEMEPTAVW